MPLNPQSNPPQGPSQHAADDSARSARRPSRQIELDVYAVIEQTLSGEGGVPELLRHPSADNRETLTALRKFILSDIQPDLAMTDPALYRKLNRLRTEMILRGWYRFFKEEKPCRD